MKATGRARRRISIFPATQRSAPDIQNRTCLNCHSGGKRTHWRGSSHPGNDVTCTHCHTLHLPSDPVLAKDNPARSMFPLPQDPTRGDACAIHAWRRLRKGGVLGLPQRARRSRAETTATTAGQRRLLHLPCRIARSVPVGAPAGVRRLHALPHPARLEHCATVEGAAAMVVSKLPRRFATYHASAFRARTFNRAQAAQTRLRLLLARACLNCHSAIHGSNHPSGARFTR